MDEGTPAVPDGGRRRRINCRVNRKYIPLKLIYLFFMAGESCALLYRSIFMRHLGMSTKQTGIIWTLERVISVILPPFLGAITDKTRRPKLVLITLLLGGGATLFSMYFIPQEELVPSGLYSPLTLEEVRDGNSSFCWTLDCNYTNHYPQESDICILRDPKRDEKHCHPDVEDVTTLVCRPRESKNVLLHPGPSNRLEINLNNSVNDPGTNSTKLDNLPSNSNAEFFRCSLLTGNSNFTSPVLFLPAKLVETLYSTLNQANMYLTTGTDSNSLCVDYDVTNDDMTCDEFILNDYDVYGVTFWVLIVLVFVSSFASIGSYPVIESSVLGALGPGKRHKFGHQRLWASVGFGSAALIVGYLKDRSAETVGPTGNTNRPYLSMFVGVLICWGCAAIVAWKLPIRAGKKSQKVRLKDIKVVLKKLKALAFFALLLFYGADVAVQEIYLFWLAEVKLKAPSFILGASTFIGALMDIPFCLAAGTLTKKFGHAALICFGMITFSLRLILCSVVTQPWQLVAVETLRCITWGLTWVVVCSYTAKISPPGLEASTMGITQATLWGLGYSAGALLGGVLFQLIGGDNVFLLFGLISMLVSVLFGIFTFLTRNKNGETGNENEKESTKFVVSDDFNVDNINDKESSSKHLHADES